LPDGREWPALESMIVNDSYWQWPERNLTGNAIDF